MRMNLWAVGRRSCSGPSLVFSDRSQVNWITNWILLILYTSYRYCISMKSILRWIEARRESIDLIRLYFATNRKSSFPSCNIFKYKFLEVPLSIKHSIFVLWAIVVTNFEIISFGVCARWEQYGLQIYFCFVPWSILCEMCTLWIFF